MRSVFFVAMGLLIAATMPLQAQTQPPVFPPPVTAPPAIPPVKTVPMPPTTTPAPMEVKDYSGLSKTIEKIVVQKLPKEFADATNWGMTIPVVGNLPFPKLRTYVKVGDHLEVPHGLWVKGKAVIADPEKDVKLVIKDIKKIEKDLVRIWVDTTVNLQGEGEFQHWQKGLSTVGVTAQATTSLVVALEVDGKIIFDLSKFPPDLKIEPKVSKSRIDIKEFELFKPGPFGQAGNLNLEIKNLLQQVARGLEPIIQDRANEAIVQSFKDGKSGLSLSSLLKSLGN